MNKHIFFFNQSSFFFLFLMYIPIWFFVFLTLMLVSFELRMWCKCCVKAYIVAKENEMPASVKHMYS